MFLFSGMNQDETEHYREQKDSVIFLVDCHSSMFRVNPNNHSDDGGDTSSVSFVLKAALSFMKNKIITNDNDKIGVILYGCDKTSNSLNLKNVYIQQKLDVPDAATIKNFQLAIDDFASQFGPAPQKGSSPLFEALWTCHQEFKSVEKQSFTKRIFLFTDDDNPGT